MTVKLVITRYIVNYKVQSVSKCTIYSVFFSNLYILKVILCHRYTSLFGQYIGNRFIEV